MFATYLAARERRWTHSRCDPESAVCERSNGLVATLTAAFTASSVACYVTDKSEPMARTDHLRAKGSKSAMGNRAGLKIPNVVGSVVHKLDVPNATLVRFLKPFPFPLKKIQSFNIAHNGGIARCVRLPGLPLRAHGAARGEPSSHLPSQGSSNGIWWRETCDIAVNRLRK
jgi:hypothetical protein